MASVNKVILLGRTGKEPEMRYTGAGKAVANFSIATQEGYGENKSTAWHNIVAFEKTADVVGQYLHKGDMVFIEGRITYRTWDDKEGNKRYATDIVADRIQLLAGKKSDDGDDRLPDRQPTRREEPVQQRNTRNADKPTFPNDDDLPF